jgi:hypothetical protein
MRPADRLRALVVGVIRGALETTARAGVVVLDDGSPEAELLGQWCTQELGSQRTWRAHGPVDAPAHAGEALRYRARTLAIEQNALTAHPANKTALLLAADWPVEPLLPLGDLYASQIAALTGGWSGPADVKRLVELAGGIESVDRALGSWFEQWRPADVAVGELPAECRGPFLEAVRRGRFWRERAGLIPKLSVRTIGIDLFA